jgi:hypothetical protein
MPPHRTDRRRSGPESAQAAAGQRRRRIYASASGAVFAAAVVAIVVLAATSERGGTEPIGQVAAPGHIHGLGIDPGDRSLLIATHDGLFRAAEESSEVARVGDSDRDLMGFSVVGTDHFLASGHPGRELDELPPHLGLTESRDGGLSWESVSLLGEADFHVLRAQGRRVYGHNGADGRFMVSDNLGRDWSERTVPSEPVDLAVSPVAADHLIAATADGLQESRDAARTWRAVSEQRGLLAWPQPDRLFLIELDGRTMLSNDGGRTFRPQGHVDGQPVAFTADGDRLYVALEDGAVMQSTDGGASFTPRARL